MKNSIKQRAKKVPKDIKLMVSKSMDTARKIMNILEMQGKTQKDLANLLGKKESEISKWLQGTHNFTYKTICKVEAVLGEEVISVAARTMPYTINLDKLDSFKAVATSCQEVYPESTWLTSLEDNNLIIKGYKVGTLGYGYEVAEQLSYSCK